MNISSMIHRPSAAGTAERDAKAMLRDTLPGSQYRGRILMKLKVSPNKARPARRWPRSPSVDKHPRSTA